MRGQITGLVAPECATEYNIVSVCNRPGISEYVGSTANTTVSNVTLDALLELESLDTSRINWRFASEVFWYLYSLIIFCLLAGDAARVQPRAF